MALLRCLMSFSFQFGQAGIMLGRGCATRRQSSTLPGIAVSSCIHFPQPGRQYVHFQCCQHILIPAQSYELVLHTLPDTEADVR